jgi:hypothetical protein
MRGGDNSFVIEVTLLNNDNRGNNNADLVAANPQQIIEWYNEHLYVVDEEYMTDVVVTHLNGNRFRIDYQPGEKRDPEWLKVEISTFANPDDDGNHPITIDGEEYGVMGDVVEDAQGGRRRRRH